MTQADFCRYIGVSLRSGAGFERGERTPPRHLALLCEYIVRYGPLQLPGDAAEGRIREGTATVTSREDEREGLESRVGAGTDAGDRENEQERDVETVGQRGVGG